MGALGAAIATVFSQGFSFVCCVVFLWHNRHEMGFEVSLRDFLHPKMEYLSPLTKLGVPMAIKSASIHFSKLFVNSWINSYGVAVSAMAGIVNKLGSICNLISNSVNAAGSSMVGQNVGAQKYDRVPRIMVTCFCFTLCTASLMSAAVYLFPQLVFGLFTDEAAVMAIAMEFQPIAVVLFLGSACRSPMNALINGSGNHRVNFATAILDGIVMRIGLSVLLGLVLDLEYLGFWLGDALAGYTPFFIGLVYYFSGAWKTRKYVIKEEKA
jgi:Na+-driven multidrug efflux pump